MVSRLIQTYSNPVYSNALADLHIIEVWTIGLGGGLCSPRALLVDECVSVGLLFLNDTSPGKR